MNKPIDVTRHPWKFDTGESNEDIYIIGETHNMKKYLFLTSRARIIESYPPFETFTRLQDDLINQDKITAIAIANKSNLLAISFANGRLVLYDTDNKKEVTVFTRKSTSNLKFMSFTPSDDGILSADSEGDLYSYTVGKQIQESRIFTNGIKSFSIFAPSLTSNFVFFNSKSDTYLRLTYSNTQNIIFSSQNNDPLSAVLKVTPKSAIYYCVASSSLCIFSVYEKGNWEVSQYLVLPLPAIEIYLPNVSNC